MENLPPIILYKIFDYLKGDDYLKVSLTCPYFNRVLSETDLMSKKVALKLCPFFFSNPFPKTQTAVLIKLRNLDLVSTIIRLEI
jgi:F-box-like